jgi:CheY-like chemotaxis protein
MSSTSPSLFTILVADDEPAQRSIVGRLVTSHLRSLQTTIPFHVLYAENAEAALDILNTHENDIHLIFSDHEMGPGMTGKDLLVEISKKRTPPLLRLRTTRPIDEFSGLAEALITHIQKGSPTENDRIREALTLAHDSYIGPIPRPKADSVGSEGTSSSFTTEFSGSLRKPEYSPLSAKEPSASTDAPEEERSVECCLAFKRLFSCCFGKKENISSSRPAL